MATTKTSWENTSSLLALSPFNTVQFIYIYIYKLYTYIYAHIHIYISKNTEFIFDKFAVTALGRAE